MARGYPDFFGYQITPKYGTPVKETKAWTAFASATTETIYSISGKGRTYGGYVVYYGTGSVFTLSVLTCIIDGVSLVFETPATELQYGINPKIAQPFSLSQYEQQVTNKYVCYTCEKDWTFGQSLVVELENASGANLTVRGFMYWGQMI